MQKLRQFFKFISSVKLAVPLMVVLILATTWGTLVESMYNSDLARIKVYHANWFQLLMALLWINIFSATLSRWPFKFRHLGFITTHIGLLTLLAGGLITAQFGTDGTLRVQEGQANNQVILNDLVLGIGQADKKRMHFVPIPTMDQAQDASFFSSINEQIGSVIKISRSLPFVEPQTGYTAGTGTPEYWALEFQIKSNFFNVTKWLHTRDEPVIEMGPAVFRWVPKEKAKDKNAKTEKSARIPNSDTSSGDESLVIKNKKTGTVLKTLAAKDIKNGATLILLGAQITVKKKYQSAAVHGNKLTEGSGEANPALELELKKGDKTSREIVYAKFPNFSMSKDSFDLAFIYVSSKAPPAPSNEAAAQAHTAMSADTVAAQDLKATDSAASMMKRGQDEIRFSEGPDAQSVTVELFKNNAKIASRLLKIGETYVTPWMGTELTLKGLIPNPISADGVLPIEPIPKESMLPPAALRIIPHLGAPSDEFWLIEGSQGRIQVDDLPYEIYFGRRFIDLPFSLELQKFEKITYPGSEMAKQFQSQVRIPELNISQLISMNEPLETQGYTIYQSSFEEQPGGKFASIFSVNKDPGRWVKYIGSIILALGIIIFTLMRSRLFQKRKPKS